MKSQLAQGGPTCATRLAAASASGHACRATRNSCNSARIRRSSTRQAWPGHATHQEKTTTPGTQITSDLVALETTPLRGQVREPATNDYESPPKDVQPQPGHPYPYPLAPGLEAETLRDFPSKESGACIVPAIERHSLLDGVRSVLLGMMGRGDEANAEVALPQAKSNISCFSSKVAPKINISSYLSRISTHIPLSDSSFILALVYIDRIGKQGSTCRTAVNSKSWVRLVITAIMLASKYLEDEGDLHYNNAAYAKVGGLGVQELDLLETHFLKLLDWKLFVTEAEYMQFYGAVYNSTPCCDQVS